MRNAQPGLTFRAAPWTRQGPSSTRARQLLGVFENSVAVIVRVAQAYRVMPPGDNTSGHARRDVAAWSRFDTRTRLFMEAAQRAKALQRSLVVIGDPDAGLHTRLRRAYDCGDVCVDANGCPMCPVVQVADITAGPIADKHVVAMARVTTTHKAIAAGVLAGASLLALWPSRRKEETP